MARFACPKVPLHLRILTDTVATARRGAESSIPGRRYLMQGPSTHHDRRGQRWCADRNPAVQLDPTNAPRVPALEVGEVALAEHLQNLPPSFGPSGKGASGTVWGQP